MRICYRKAVREDFGRINELFMEMLRAIYGGADVKGYQAGDLDHYFAGKEDWICAAEIDGRVERSLSMEVHHELCTMIVKSKQNQVMEQPTEGIYLLHGLLINRNKIAPLKGSYFVSIDIIISLLPLVALASIYLLHNYITPLQLMS